MGAPSPTQVFALPDIYGDLKSVAYTLMELILILKTHIQTSVVIYLIVSSLNSCHQYPGSTYYHGTDRATVPSAQNALTSPVSIPCLLHMWTLKGLPELKVHHPSNY